jgi:hypothetical protein
VGLYGAVVFQQASNTVPEGSTPEEILQAMAASARSVKEILMDLNEQAKSLFSDVGTQEKLKALAENDIISKQAAKDFAGILANGQPMVQVFADELTEIMQEYFSLMGQQSLPCVPSPNARCNICGRLCNGIELTATITSGGVVKTYSGSNMQENIDTNPRQVCALCFCENVLRRVICDKGDSPLYLFVFPEYAFTPYHTVYFESDILNRLIVKTEEPTETDIGVETDEEMDSETEEELVETTEKSVFLQAIKEFIFKSSTLREIRTGELWLVTPVLVVPYQTLGKKVSHLETWVQLFQQVLKLREKLGLKYLLADNFYPEVFDLDGVRGALELQGVHPTLLRRLRKWVAALRVGQPERIQRLSASVLTLSEANRLEELTALVTNLSYSAATEKTSKGKSKTDWKKEKRLRLGFVGSSSIFPAADLYKSKKRRD